MSQGHMLPQNTLVLCMVAIGSHYVLLGTNTGQLIVCDAASDKKQQILATLPDSILCLTHVK